MAGTYGSSNKLDFTLEYISNILQNSPINDWFIAYGTLLGIVRDDRCIEGDNDIDINISCDYDQIKSILLEYNLIPGYTKPDFPWHGIQPDEKKIIKTIDTDMFHSIDFYFCDVNDGGDFLCHWEHTTWHNSYENLEQKKFIQKPWKSTVLNLPNNYIEKLHARYGEWQVRSNSIGPSPKSLP